MLRKNVRVGAKVICIDDYFKEEKGQPCKVKDLILPKKNVTYTVRSVEEAGGGEIGVRLLEVVNKKYRFAVDGEKEPMFSLNRFKHV